VSVIQSLGVSIVQSIPDHRRDLDQIHGRDDGEQIPAPDVVSEVPVEPEARRENDATWPARLVDFSL
jgi:hypothetical protein